MHHVLKIETPYFEAVLSGKKTFEIRYDDRGYNAGDTIELREIHPNNGITSGRKAQAAIGYVTAYKQNQGFVVFSLLGVTSNVGVQGQQPQTACGSEEDRTLLSPATTC